MTLRVFVLSDVRLHREGLVEFIASDGRIEVAGTGTTPAEAILAAERVALDALLLDMATRDALCGAVRITRRCPRLPVVAVGVTDDGNEVLPCAEAGIAAFVSRDGTIDDLVRVVVGATAGKVTCSHKTAGALMRRVASLAGSMPPALERPTLTPRELEVIQLLNEGLTNKEIANRLHIAASTARNHVHSILEKLNAHTRGEAASKGRSLLGVAAQG